MKSKRHLYEIDLMRTFIILGVVCVHVISFFSLFVDATSPTGVAYGAGLIATHFTREAFLFLTGLVLFVTYYGRPMKATTFWMKRFKLIIIPYFAWTLIYILFSNTYLQGANWSFLDILKTFAFSVLEGNQFYLYFLLISIQIYAVFPFLVTLLRKLSKWHAWILLGSFALQLWLMWFNKAVLQDLHSGVLPPFWAAIDKYRDRLLITYQFWLIGGALMAIHYEKVKNYVLKHTKLVYGVLLSGLVGIWSYYFVQQLLVHEDMVHSTLVLQPVMIPYSLIVTLFFWNIGVKWDRLREAASIPRFSRFIMTVSKASFGVFLVHPIVLHYVEMAVYVSHPQATLRGFLLPLAIVVVYGVSIILSRIIGSIPYVGYIVGQKTTVNTWMSKFSRRSNSVASNQ